jgi:hypothetical protein
VLGRESGDFGRHSEEKLVRHSGWWKGEKLEKAIKKE